MHKCSATGLICTRCAIKSYHNIERATVAGEDALLPDTASDFLFLGPVHHVAMVDGCLCLHDLTLLLCPGLWLYCLSLQQ